MPDTIIFDGEGVVIDSEPVWDLSQQEFLRRRGVAYDRALIKPLLAGRSVEEGVEIMKRQYGITGATPALAQERIAIVREIMEREVSSIPGFVEFHQRIKKRFKTALATMMPKLLLDAVVVRLDLHRLFGPHIYEPQSRALASKPEPDLFLFAARQLDSEPRNCVVIEDSPNGLAAANRAGMISIGLTTTFDAGKLQRARLVVSSFDDGLLEYIQSLDSR
jgi:beta-phosphoglucomutase